MWNNEQLLKLLLGLKLSFQHKMLFEGIFWHLELTKFAISQRVNHLGKCEQNFHGCHHARAREMYFQIIRIF